MESEEVNNGIVKLGFFENLFNKISNSILSAFELIMFFFSFLLYLFMVAYMNFNLHKGIEALLILLLSLSFFLIGICLLFNL